MLYLTIFNGDFDVNLSMACSMVLNTTFNNGLVILWLPVLLVEETVGFGENHRPLSNTIVHHSLLEIRPHNISSDRH